MDDALTISYEGAVAEITLSRPDVLNRFDAVLHHRFTEALAEVRHHRDVRAVVLASKGKVFSAGGDFDHIVALRDDTALRIASVDEGRRLLHSLIDLPIPVVTALHGDAIGLGATIVLATDAVVSAPGVGLSDPHVAIGLVAGDGGCVVWPATAGMLRAKRHLLTGDRLTAEDAYTLGLVTDLVPTPADVLPAARSLAQRIAGLPPLAVQGTKRALNRSLQQRAGEVLDLSFALEALSLISDDVLEAIQAFQAKRQPSYRGT